MKTSTLVFIRRDTAVLLAMKKRGFGAGKYNGAGGKVEPNESTEEAACREVLEETGIQSTPRDLTLIATIDFYFDQNEVWNQHCFVYETRVFTGEPQETEEMKPQWFTEADIPYDHMWIDDRIWLPSALAGTRAHWTFTFSADGTEIQNYTQTPLVSA
jgi:8-oxo-dGTP pyrophosphatase MutT (NUDIX family)